MCTLALAWLVDRRWPIVVAANRDEKLGRPSEGWALRDAQPGIRIAAPRDVVAGGTWIGVSSRGVFSAVTNYHAPVAWVPERSRRSRGELVNLALAAPSAAAAREALTALPAERWNPFHLAVADGASAFLWWNDGEGTEFLDLAPGLHVITERSRDGRCARGDLIRARWPLDASVPRLRDVLTIHGPDVATSTCIHADPRYGTRSSAILRLAPDLVGSELYVSDVRPCVAPLEDRSSLLVAIARNA